MLTKIIKAIVNFCTHKPWITLAIAVLLAIPSGIYTVTHFEINTDINNLISKKLPWRQRELVYEAAFPQTYESILAVVDAPTSELASEASMALVEGLKAKPQLFKTVLQTQDSEFFTRNGLLFLPTDNVASITHQLDDAEPLIQILWTDPTLRGLTQTLSLVLSGAQSGQIPFDGLGPPLDKFSSTIEDVMAGKRATFSWRELLQGKPSTPGDLRRFVQIVPVLDYGALEPGREATNAIRQTSADLKLDSRYFARVRITGPVPIADDEFATVQQGALLNGIVTLVIVLAIVWLALRSARIIVAVFVTLAIGLVVTAALGLMMVGALNLISIAFAVLFVGVGVDFGIQFSVRYRADRYDVKDLHRALALTAEHVGAPLTLAGAATAAGFFAFLPTDYKGVSELGQIAGAGMIIAYLASITVLPAMLALLHPAGEPEAIGFKALAPVDAFLDRHRLAVLYGTIIVVVAGMPLLYFLKFDFNPMNLRSPSVESVGTYLELRQDPSTGASDINVLASSIDAARPVAAKLAKVPEVSSVRTIENFVPEDQPKKLELIHALAETLDQDFKDEVHKAPTDAQNIEALNASVGELNKTAGDRQGPAADSVRRLSRDLAQLAKADPSKRATVEQVLTEPLKLTLTGIRASLQAETVTLETLPPELKQDWMASDGRARVEALPKGDPDNNDVIRSFASAVLAVQPDANGGPISILESGHTVVRAFIEAGAWALISIAILLWITLRRFLDVLLTLIPLIVAGMVTLELCVIIGMPLNFANIIALPLLLGIGVAFKIYFIMAWRAGQTNLLQSSLTRAVIFSAMTTATAFGSLWLSSHPGTASMGKLLALSLVCTLAAAVLFQPVLMGRPRDVEGV